MSLQRYINNESILSLNIPQYGKLYSDHYLQLLNSDSFIPLVNFNINSLLSELHIYSFTGNYLGSSFSSTLDFDSDTKNILIDVRNLFKIANITKGSYKLVNNLFYPVFGSPSADDTANVNWPVYVREISPERNEIALSLTNQSHKSGLAQFRAYADQLKSEGKLNNIVVNFGKNRVYKVINIKSDVEDPLLFYIKIHGTLDADINDLDRAWFAVEVMDSYIDTVILTSKQYEGPVNVLKGPKFSMDVDDYNSQSTIYQSWDDLLDANADTSQRIIDNIISGSGYATLNIDYTDYNNFIFYSSAGERLANFQQKMLLIEEYKNKIVTLNTTSYSGSQVELITNGTFIGGTGWSSASPVSYGSNQASVTADPAGGTNHIGILSQSIATTIGQEYTVDFTASFFGGGFNNAQSRIRIYVNDVLKYFKTNQGLLTLATSSAAFTGSGADIIKIELAALGSGYPAMWGAAMVVDNVSVMGEVLTQISSPSFVGANISTLNQRITNLETNFDPFERWLYHHPTSSIFTHDISGSLTPWPKYISGSRYYNHHVTSSIASEWYEGNFASASYYDQRNVNSLWYSIPEHILMDNGNSEYVTFVNMVGHHFDVLYSYIHALTEIHNKDEHPERGASNQLLGHIAKSFGWTLQNTNQLSNLWLYKLGSDNSGSFITSSGMDVIPHEQQTQQIWKRIVNNLPYLLKTKGSSRSVKAMMSIYGIPHTLLSIKEYGGPSLDTSRPIAIEDYYAYKLIASGGSHVKIPRDTYSAKSYGWGNGQWCGGEISSSVLTRDPDTIEFRFAIPDYDTGSLGADGYSGSRLLYAAQFTGSHASTPNQFIYALSVTPSNQYGDDVVSGSTHYGKLRFETFTSQSVIYSGSSDYLPIFDGDLWTVRISNNDPFRSDVSRPYGPLRIDISRATDSLYGRPTFSSSFTVGTGHLILGPGHSYLGGMPSSSIANLNVSSSIDYANYTIHLQGYKEYYTTYSEDTFNTHVLNPRAYNTDSISGSFYSLYRYYPLGLDEQRWDHSSGSQYQFLSSSHPDRDITHGYAEFVGFSGSQSTQYESLYETAYIKIPSLGGNVLYNDKIRLEDSELLYELSPDSQATVSDNDDQSIDSNRLAIVFSLADHINRDIYNHMGPGNLDSWIGDPQYEFSSSYSTLEIKRNEYYQKYEQRNDINAFIRILSVFDYTFFEQIKQLVPARADLITGILIEPTILERSKIQLSKQPSVEATQWEQTIDLNIISQSGEFPYYEKELIVTSSIEGTYNVLKGLISSSLEAEASYNVLKGLISSSFTSSARYDYYTASIGNPFIISASSVYTTKSGSFCAEVDVIIDPYTGTTGSLETYVSESVTTCHYKRKVCYFDAYRLTDSLFRNSILDNTNDWYVTGNPVIFNETGSYLNIHTFKFSNGIHPTNNSSSYSLSQSINTDSGSIYLLRYYARPYTTLNDMVISINGSLFASQSISLATSSYGQWVKEYRLLFTGSGQDSIQLSSSIALYNAEVHKYLGSEYNEQWRRLAYKELRRPSFCVEVDWNYQINECSVQNNSRFEGSKLSGAGINVDSNETPDGGPVVVVTEVNPNQSNNSDHGDNGGNIRLK